MEFIKKENHFQVQSKAMDIRRGEDGEIKSIVLEGYASTKNKDRVNDIVLPSAFEKAMKTYMENPRVFLQHKENIGDTIDRKINSKGLYVKTEILLNISLDGTNEVRLFDAIEKGLYKTYSIGYRVNDVEQVEVKENGVVVGYEWVIKELDLMEISLVSVPANPYALIKSIEDCLPENTKLEIEEAIEQLKEMMGEANIVKEEEIKETEEETVENEVKPEEKEDEADDCATVVGDEPETEEDDDGKPKDKEKEEKEVKTEETEAKEEVKEEDPKDSQDTENDTEAVSGEGEKSQVVEEAKEIKVEAKEEVVETKSFVETKTFEEKIETLSNYSKKEVEELRGDIKTINKGYLDVIKLFNALQEYTKKLEETMDKVVIKKGYTYEKTQEPQLGTVGKALKHLL